MSNLSKTLILLHLFALVIFGITGCTNLTYTEVSLKPSATDGQKHSSSPKSQEQIRFALATGISPEKNIAIYGSLAAFLEEQLDRPVKIVQRKSLAEMNSLIEKGKVDVALLSASAYLKSRETGAVEPLVVAKISGEVFHKAYILVQKDAPFYNMEDLAGETVVFSDPWSGSGAIYPMAYLKKKDKTPEAFFGNYFYSYCYFKSVAAVLSGMAKAAAIDGCSYELLVAKGYINPTKLRVIETYQNVPNPIIVVRQDLSSEVKQNIKKALLDADNPKPNTFEQLHFTGFQELENRNLEELNQYMGQVLYDGSS